MATNIINRSYFDAAEKGRQSRDDEPYRQARNILASQEVARGADLQRLASNPNSTADQYARAGRADVANYMHGRENAAAAAEKDKASRVLIAAQYAIQSDQPKALLQQQFPDIVAMNPNFATESDDQIRQQLQGVIARFGSQAGVGPTQPKEQEFTLSAGQTRFGPDGKQIASVAPTPEKTQPRFRAMAPAELATYGLPAGSAAQINDSTGQIQVLNKPSVAPQQTAAERKAKLEANLKLPRVSAAMRRAERLAQAVKSIGGNSFLDGGPADAKALQYTEQGRELMASAAQLMPELQALTRVPGIGSQSDLEARLASLALPSLEMDPATNERSMAELTAFIQDLRAAYTTIAEGGQPTEIPEEVGPATVGPSLDEIRAKYGR
jgi:hypothetical protein